MKRQAKSNSFADHSIADFEYLYEVQSKFQTILYEFRAVDLNTSPWLGGAVSREELREIAAEIQAAVNKIGRCAHHIQMRNLWINYNLIAQLPTDARFVNGISLETMGTSVVFCRNWCDEHREYAPEKRR